MAKFPQVVSNMKRKLKELDESGTVELIPYLDGWELTSYMHNNLEAVTLHFNGKGNLINYTTGSMVSDDYVGRLCDGIIEGLQENDIKVLPEAVRIYEDSYTYS